MSSCLNPLSRIAVMLRWSSYRKAWKFTAGSWDGTRSDSVAIRRLHGAGYGSRVLI
jgi:hypothetical protein